MVDQKIGEPPHALLSIHWEGPLIRGVIVRQGRRVFLTWGKPPSPVMVPGQTAMQNLDFGLELHRACVVGAALAGGGMVSAVLTTGQGRPQGRAEPDDGENPKGES